MAEKSRKKEHFELEGMAIMAITTSSSIRVKRNLFICFYLPFLRVDGFFDL